MNEAEGEIWSNPICITWSPVRNVTGEASAHAQQQFRAVKAKVDFVAYNKAYDRPTTWLRSLNFIAFTKPNKHKMRSKGFSYNLAGFVFEYFCDSRRILATFTKFCLNSLFATWSYRFTRHPARAGWRVWDLGNGTIMLQKLFNPEWQIPSKSFLLSSFLFGFSFSPTAEISRLELEFEESLLRKTGSKWGLDRSQMELPIKKNKFSYFARSRLRLRPQEIWERDYLFAIFLIKATET